jgi:hypothetical protein
MKKSICVVAVVLAIQWISASPRLWGQQAGGPTGVQVTSGVWRSTEQFEGEPRISVAFRERGNEIEGWAVLLGQHRKNDDRVTLGLTFHTAKRNGNTVTFETLLPEDEGTIGWSFNATSPTTGTLTALTENGQPVQDHLVWELKREN